MISIGKFFRAGIFAVLFMTHFDAVAQQEKDSTHSTKWLVYPRLHSSGYFPFTGALLNHNLVADVNVFMEKKTWGFFLFQSVDLQDRHSYVNYMQPGIFATFHVTPNVRLRAFFGYILSQTNSFCDPESDYYSAVQVSWTISPKLRLENTLLFYDYSTSKKLANRFLLEWNAGKFRISGYVWQRTVLDEKFNSTSGAIALGYPIPISDKVSIEVTATYMGYLTEAMPDFALRQGAFLTVAVPLTLQ